MSTKRPITLGPGRLAGLTNSHRIGSLLNAVSWVGFSPQNGIVPPLVITAWLLGGGTLEAKWQLVSWSSSGVSPLIERVIARRRPPAPLWRGPSKPTGDSFPSSHALTNTSFYGTTLYMLARSYGPVPIRAVGIGACAAIIALMGPARLYAREHWVSDVAAGYAIGAAVAGVVALGYERDVRSATDNE
jgi:membrane-associated phospholipid phosphatase